MEGVPEGVRTGDRTSSTWSGGDKKSWMKKSVRHPKKSSAGKSGAVMGRTDGDPTGSERTADWQGPTNRGTDGKVVTRMMMRSVNNNGKFYILY